MVKCRDIKNMNLDGMWFVAGENGLDRVVSWTYVVLTRPFDDHMNEGNFALCSVDFVRFNWEDVHSIMMELNDLKISGFAISIKDEMDKIPDDIIALSNELSLPLFQIRWENASFVDIAQSIGNFIVSENNKANINGEFLYNLLFGYDVDDRYIEKIAKQFGMDFSIPHQVGIILVDRNKGVNVENDEHKYDYYMSTLENKISEMEENTIFMNFLNKGIVLLPYFDDGRIEKELEKILISLDSDTLFNGNFISTCLLGKPYVNPHNYWKSYHEAKNLIYKKNTLFNVQNRKVISSSIMGIYKFMFSKGNNEELRTYCDRRLQKLEEYDNANNSNLIDTFLSYYLNGFNVTKTAESLYIHRNTLQYRLNKIFELMNLNSDDYTEFLEIINCIMVKKWMMA